MRAIAIDVIASAFIAMAVSITDAQVPSPERQGTELTDATGRFSVLVPAGYTGQIAIAGIKGSDFSLRSNDGNSSCNLHYHQTLWPDNRSKNHNTSKWHDKFRKLNERVEAYNLYVVLRSPTVVMTITCHAKNNNFETQKPMFEAIIRSISVRY